MDILIIIIINITVMIKKLNIIRKLKVPEAEGSL